MRRNIDKDGRNHFVQNFRWILKSYYLDLTRIACSRLEKATTSLLRSHASRQRISQNIAEKLKPLTDEERFRIHEEGETLHVQCRDLEEWIQKQPSFWHAVGRRLEPPKCDGISDILAILMKMNTYF